MADLSNTQNPRSAGAPEDAGAVQEAVVDLTDFSAPEMARLLAARHRREQGELNEWTDDYKRLRFARWLYEHGDIDG